MRTMIVEDDQTCSLMLATLLKPYGEVVVLPDGEAAITAFTAALLSHQPFDLVCLDILMPGLDGSACLRCLRAIEHGFGRDGSSGSRILMTTSVNTPDSIFKAFRHQCEGYLTKPITRSRLVEQLDNLGFTVMP